jgi:hypothetical protein
LNDTERYERERGGSINRFEELEVGNENGNGNENEMK